MSKKIDVSRIQIFHHMNIYHKLASMSFFRFEANIQVQAGQRLMDVLQRSQKDKGSHLLW